MDEYEKEVISARNIKKNKAIVGDSRIRPMSLRNKTDFKKEIKNENRF